MDVKEFVKNTMGSMKGGAEMEKFIKIGMAVCTAVAGLFQLGNGLTQICDICREESNKTDDSAKTEE